MNHDLPNPMLTNLSARFVTDTPQRKRDVNRLNQMLSRSLIPEDAQQLKSSSFAFEAADLFAVEPSPIDFTSATIAAETAEPEFRALAREVPVRSTQLHGSLPLWAGGAAVERTVGPLTAADGRQFWFDFLKIEKLVALYIQNHANPSLLFNMRTGSQFISPLLPLAASPATTYRLGPGSIWIESQLLAPDAPNGYYTGLTIRRGQITLSADPQTINGRTTIAATTVVTVELDLQQPEVNADPSSPYGIDARDSTLRLPERLVFRFSGAGSTINEISRARWNVFGHEASFEWDRAGIGNYDAVIHRVLIPFACSERTFAIRSSKSPLNTFAGETRITRSAWALPSAPIDIVHPTPAAGIGAMLVIGRRGLTSVWRGLIDGELNLVTPYVMAEPGRLSVSDVTANNSFAHQQFKLWRDEQNEFGTTIDMRFPAVTPFLYFTFADGNEAVMASGNANVKIDRPVTVSGEPPVIRSKNTLMVVSGTKATRGLYLFDDNIAADMVDLSTKPPTIPKPIAIALRNALFKVSPANGCVLFATLEPDFIRVAPGFLYLTFRMYAYIPTLPDPYAANLVFRRQLRDQDPATPTSDDANFLMWLVCRVTWEPTVAASPADEPAPDKVNVSFHFAPAQNQFQPFPDPAPVNALAAVMAAATATVPDPNQVPGQVAVDKAQDDPTVPLPNYGASWESRTQFYSPDAFSLLDVSTKADLFGVSFGTFGGRRLMMVRTHDVAGRGSMPDFPLQAKGMDVVSQGLNVRAFTVPQVSWEPVFNLTPPTKNVLGDPSFGFNYYPDDGGPTRILNTSDEQVALAPIPLTDFLVNNFANNNDFAAIALFTLPFGLRALALLKKEFTFNGITQKGTNISIDSKTFEEKLTTIRRLDLEAGKSPVSGESNMFVGCTTQENNVLEMDGSQQGTSTLGRSVTKIFNGEFSPFDDGIIFRPRGVPVTQIGLSGYGATMFSHWVNPTATIAATSQTKFDVLMGRCAHEIIQVKSILYPWGIRVVRTITLLRTNTNYVYRYDSGWQPESDGKFDFSYYSNEKIGGSMVPNPRESPYEIHPGVVKALFNVRDIRETGDIAPFAGPLSIKKNESYIEPLLGEEKIAGADNPPDAPKNYELQPVYFTADIEIENPVTGFITKKAGGLDRKVVPSKGILGFVQLAPRGMPIPKRILRDLIVSQMGSIGGPVDTLVNIGNSDQEMRVHRFDFNNSFGKNGTDLIFAVAARGNVILPKDGSWTLVKHENVPGNVSLVPQDLSVPLIRKGRLQKPNNLVLNNPALTIVEAFKRVSLDGDLILDSEPKKELLRIANPTELLRPPDPTTINYGFLHSTDTQKVLFLTPSFFEGQKKLLSKTPPLFADAFRLANSKAVFPNIKDAVTSFGEAIALIKDPLGGAQFKPNTLPSGETVLELMDIQKASEVAYKLAKQSPIPEFPLPDKWDLINIGNSFRIYIDYKAEGAPASKLDFNIDPAAVDKWKSRMSNVSLKVDLGPFKPLLTIKGNWDARKGSEAKFGGGGSGEVPHPQIVLAKELDEVLWLLEILEDISGAKYGAAVGKGVRLAMSNKAGEYKFEAVKEIPLLKFPPGVAYDSPQVPFKLEAGLRLGAYFNSALQIETDKKQLLPSAGAFFGFYGRVSIMCVSLEIATIYAVGQANLDFGADTKNGPFLRMKFGFGAQIVVGLPVLANVSVLYMVGIEIYLDKNNLEVSGFLLFSGHADILSGLLSVTITIEAKGTVVRDSDDSTSLAAQVTFALEITVFWIIDISIEETWGERRQVSGSLMDIV